MVGDHESYMSICLDLARRGRRLVSPNPMVGAILVHENQIIGQGYHKAHGQSHAELAAIADVKDKELIKSATLYVNLEPCSHHGKTPPCADYIIEQQIKRVVVGCVDTSAKVNGLGIQSLREAGVEVMENVLSKECRFLNRRFFTFHEKQRPYVILKWAQTSDGFMARPDAGSVWISCEASRLLVHEWRTEEAAVMVGTKTALLDNPRLTVRIAELKEGEFRNPLRIVLDQDLKLPPNLNLFDRTTPTIVYNNKRSDSGDAIEYSTLDFTQNVVRQITADLHQRSITSVLVEGGAQLLNSFIEENLWDEARIFVSPKKFDRGLRAPQISKRDFERTAVGDDSLRTVFNHDF